MNDFIYLFTVIYELSWFLLYNKLGRNSLKFLYTPFIDHRTSWHHLSEYIILLTFWHNESCLYLILLLLIIDFLKL